MKKAKSYKNANSDIWLTVPMTGNYPMLLLESLSEPSTFEIIEGLVQRAYDEDQYGLDKYTQVNFKSGTSITRVHEIVSYLNLNA